MQVSPVVRLAALDPSALESAAEEGTAESCRALAVRDLMVAVGEHLARMLQPRRANSRRLHRCHELLAVAELLPWHGRLCSGVVRGELGARRTHQRHTRRAHVECAQARDLWLH